MVAGGGSVWVLDRAAGVSRSWTPTLTVVDTVRVGEDEQHLVFGADAVWLADGPATTLSRIDPVTRELTTFPTAGPVVDVTVDQAVRRVVGPDLGSVMPAPSGRP